MHSTSATAIAILLLTAAQAIAQLPFSDNFDNSFPGEPGFLTNSVWTTWPNAAASMNLTSNRNHTPGGAFSVRLDPENPLTLADYYNLGSTAGPIDASVWVYDQNSPTTGSPLNSVGNTGPASFYFGLFGDAPTPTADTDHLLIGLNPNFSLDGVSDNNYGINTESGVNIGAGTNTGTQGTNHYFTTPVTRSAAIASSADGSGWAKLEVQADSLSSGGAVRFYVNNNLVDTSSRESGVNLRYLFIGSKADAGGRSGQNYGTFWFDDVHAGTAPAAPTLQPVAQAPFTPPTKLVVPTTTDLQVWKNGSFQSNVGLNPNEPTVVLTHGFSSSPGTWPTQLAAQYPSNVNVVAWNWSSDAGNIAVPSSLGQATSRTQNEGAALGEALVSTLGSNYALPIHFIGHSLGTLVNAEAINVFNTHTNDSNNTQDTLFDDAEIANLFAPLSPGGWATAIPSDNHVAGIDNYISAYGNLQVDPKATNIILTKTTPPDPLFASFHGYPAQWYGGTMLPQNQNVPAGYQWAIERPSGTTTPLPAGQFYVQTATPRNPAPEFQLSQITSVQAISQIAARDAAELPALAVIGSYFLTGDMIHGAIQTLGDVSDAVTNEPATQFASASLGVKVGLGNQTSGQAKPNALVPQLADAASPAPSDAWLPITIPANAQNLSFSFTYDGVDPNDYLTAGINDTQLFALEGAYVPNDTLVNSGLLDISQWDGQTVDLFLGNTGIAPNGFMSVQDIQFQVVPEPGALSISILAVSLTALRSGQHRSGGRRNPWISWRC